MLVATTGNATDFGDLTSASSFGATGGTISNWSWRFIMATLKVNTLSGIGTEGPVLDGGLKFRSLNYMTLPKGDTTQRGRGRAVFFSGI